MWNNFCAVVEDLFWFALGAQTVSPVAVAHVPAPQVLLAPFKSAPVHLPLLMPATLAAPAVSTLLAAQPARLGLSAHSTVVTKFKTIALETKPAASILHAPVVMYVSQPLGTACLHVPQIDFDAVIEVLPYGTAVTVIGYAGRFASVNRSNITGWVLKDDITPQKNEVWPEFIRGGVYDVLHADTLKSRSLINDMFAGGALALPLQAGEYVTVRLKSEHRTITWSRKRPRVAGDWARLLRGTAGIHIGVTPKTDTVIEWRSSDGEGRLGYVEAVAPDQAITISAVGTDEAGLFTIKTMSEEIWRELRPVFIEVA